MALGRQIALWLALLAAAGVLLGCGGEDDELPSAEIEPAAANSINEKLELIAERADEGDCFGDNSAEQALATLQEEVDGELLADVSEEFRADLQEVLGRLGDQIASDCEEVKEPTTTEDTATTTTETEETSTETETTTTETEEPTTTDTKPAPPPKDDAEGEDEGDFTPPESTPPGQGGIVPGTGGTSPGGDRRESDG